MVGANTVMFFALFRVSTRPAFFTAVTSVDRAGLFDAAVATGSLAIPSKLPLPCWGTVEHAGPNGLAMVSMSLSALLSFDGFDADDEDLSDASSLPSPLPEQAANATALIARSSTARGTAADGAGDGRDSLPGGLVAHLADSGAGPPARCTADVRRSGPDGAGRRSGTSPSGRPSRPRSGRCTARTWPDGRCRPSRPAHGRLRPAIPEIPRRPRPAAPARRHRRLPFRYTGLPHRGKGSRPLGRARPPRRLGQFQPDQRGPARRQCRRHRESRRRPPAPSYDATFPCLSAALPSGLNPPVPPMPPSSTRRSHSPVS